LKKELSFLAEYQNILIPKELDYQNIPNLSSEGREALMRERPLNLLRAKKIAGVRPTDLSTLYRFLAKIDS
jgi:tRNA uridine 5-carboxymethylaminomethyl modification enzyme